MLRQGLAGTQGEVKEWDRFLEKSLEKAVSGAAGGVGEKFLVHEWERFLESPRRS